MIVLDASVLIAHLDASDALHQRATALLAEASDEPLAISPITAAEVVLGPARASQLDRAIAALQDLAVDTVRLDDGAPVRLALLRAGTGLKLPDCCVLLAAESAHAGVATFDDRLAAAARQRNVTVLDP